MHAIDRGADDCLVLKSVGVFLASRPEPFDKIGDGGDGSRTVDLFFGLADALADPGEIEDLHRPFDTMWRSPAWK